MSQRSRIALAAALLAALFLTAPVPSHAVVHPSWQLPLAGAWERAWSWLAQLLPGGEPQKPPTGQRKAGSTTNPNGGTTTGTTPAGTQSDAGGMIDPDGAK